MMAPSLLTQGMILGFSIAAPLGPIGVLCLRRSMADGLLAGFITGMGAATADAVYGSIVAFGLTAVMGMLIALTSPLCLLGGLFLCYLGYRTFFAVPMFTDEEVPPTRSLFVAFVSTFLLTVANPMTIVLFLGIFASAPLRHDSLGQKDALSLVAGIFLGSAAWWLLLSSAAAALASRFTPSRLLWINKLAGTTIALFGLAALCRWATQH